MFAIYKSSLVFFTFLQLIFVVPSRNPVAVCFGFRSQSGKEKIRGKLTNFKFLIELYQQPHSIVVNSNDNE